MAVADILFFYSTKPERANCDSRSGQKVGTFWPEDRINIFCPPVGNCQLSCRCANQCWLFPASSNKKKVYWPRPEKNNPSYYMFGFALDDNYMHSETFFIFVAYGRNMLFLIINFFEEDSIANSSSLNPAKTEADLIRSA